MSGSVQLATFGQKWLMEWFLLVNVLILYKRLNLYTL